MRLKRISIKNFRAIRDLTIDVGDHTVLVGGNGVGKSCILKAVDKFFSPSSRMEIDDYHERNVADPIEIALTFVDFSAEESDRFGSRIHGDEMTVARIFSTATAGSRYYGMTPRHPAFAEIRAIEGARERRTAFNAIPREGIYEDLEAAQNADQMMAALDGWEHLHPNLCELDRDDGQFLGFANVGRGSLSKYISFVFVPAVRDAHADAVDGKNTVISQLIELLVRNVVNQKQEILEWQQKASAEYRDLTSPENIGELGDLTDKLNETLKVFYSDSGMDLQWRPIDDLKITLPTANVSLLEQGFTGPVEGKGHGLQRAFIFTILQHLAQAMFSARANDAPDEGQEPASGNLILAIEEPELYQHPTKQRHLATVLRAISSGGLPGVMTSTQLLVCSHSPHFVATDKFDEIRLARRVAAADEVRKECVIHQVTYDDVIADLHAGWDNAHAGMTHDSLKVRLHVLSNAVAEGFFANAVVLVEGGGDFAAISAVAEANGVSLTSLGIAVLPIEGKTKIDRPLIIFRRFGIPCYAIWDNDSHSANDPSGQAANIALQKICGIDDPQDFGTQITPNFACLGTKLETILETEIGAEFQTQIGLANFKFGLKKKHLLKNPVAMGEIVRLCYQGNHRSETLDQIVAEIRKLGEG